MEASSEDKPLTVPRIPSLPNFRVLCSANYASSARHKGLIYRSSRPDLIDESDLGKFRQLGIKCIIDFRGRKEYSKATGTKLVDDEYDLFSVKTPCGRNFKPQEIVQFIPLDKVTCNKTKGPEITMEDIQGTRFRRPPHFLIDFYAGNYVWTVFNRAPWYRKLYSMLFLIYDFVFNTGYKHFLRFFMSNMLNCTGLVGQYRDMIDLSQKAICAALKLMCEESNYPVLINCAHGKDRTGIISALVLSCCGKSRKEIVDEYAKSADGIIPLRERMHRELVERYHMSEDFLTAREETMAAMLDYIEERYGSVETYLEIIGFGTEEQNKLRRVVTGEDPISHLQDDNDLSSLQDDL